VIRHIEISNTELKRAIRSQSIVLGGNIHLKIYGLLNCSSGKRMKKENRVFFSSLQEAMQYDYRPCGHCMRAKYKLWKQQKVDNL